MPGVLVDDLIGKPFADGGRGPEFYDCWGLAREVFRRYEIILPDYRISCLAKQEIDHKISSERPLWRRCNPNNPPVPALLVIRQHTKFCNHTGVYLGKGRFIHTMKKTGVIIERTDHIFWRRKIEGFYLPGWIKLP